MSSENLVTKLSSEIQRVSEIKGLYESIPGGGGRPAAMNDKYWSPRFEACRDILAILINAEG